jgi:tetratricopeptide (TPR) repeat protein
MSGARDAVRGVTAHRIPAAMYEARRKPDRPRSAATRSAATRSAATRSAATRSVATRSADLMIRRPGSRVAPAMRTFQRRAGRLALGTTAAGIFLGALLVGGTAAVHLRGAATDRAAPPGLGPQAAALRYRYAISPATDAAASAAADIAALEARAQAMPSPFDDAELAERYFRRAQQDGDPADYDLADARARRSLDRLASPNPAVLTLAKLADVRHDFRAAIDLAHRHRGRSAGAQIILATAHLALGELADAADAACAALAIKPDSAGHLMRALVLQAQGRDPEAALDFARAARAEEPGDLPSAARLRALWGRFLLRRGEAVAAARVLDEAVRIVPGFPLATAMRGELALRTGHPADAALLFEQAFIASRQVRYLIDQARAHELAGNLAAATALRDQVEHIVRGELGAGGLGHRLDLVEVLVDRGRPTDIPEAVALARDEVGRRGSFEARFQLARALARSGARDDAERQVQAALASGAHEAQLYELAAALAARRSDTASAALYTRLADQLDPAGSRVSGSHARSWRTVGLELPR